MTKRPPVIVYHADCIDGAAAAWVIGKAIAAARRNATFIPYDHADHAGSEARIRAALKTGDTVYFADIAPEGDFLDALLAAGNDVRIFDHHKSAAPNIESRAAANLCICFDPAAPSAAGLVWRHFYPEKKPPDVIGLIDLMDGAASGLKTQKDFNAAALVDAQDIRTPQRARETMRKLAKLKFNAMAKKGAPIAADQNNRINKLLAHVPTVRIQLLPDTPARAIPIVNGDIRHYGRTISERLVNCGKKNGAPAAFMWALQKNGTVSLNIRTDGTPDASEIAKHLSKIAPDLTGGGHKDAAVVHFPSLEDFARLMPTQPAPATKIRPKPPSPSPRFHQG